MSTTPHNPDPPTDLTDLFETKPQTNAYTSPWTAGHRARYLCWTVARTVLFRPTPKPLYRWRLWLLRRFGADITGTCYVAGSAVVRYPWLLTMRDRAALGEGAEVYNLARVTLGARTTIAQQAYLCAGTHDLSTPTLPLVVAPITIDDDVFVGARALVLPGVTIGRGAVVGAGAVVSRGVAPWMIVAGNPARPIKRRDTSGFADASSPA